jgi:hypothetical protein
MSNEQTTTPGPWRMGEAHGGGLIAICADVPHRLVVADAYYRGIHLTTARANAQLIAAAPELLEASMAALDALNDVAQVLDANYEETRAQLRAAIKKAEGRTA